MRNNTYLWKYYQIEKKKEAFVLSPYLSVANFQEEQNVPIESLLLKTLARIRSRNFIFFCFCFDTSLSSPATKLSTHECLPWQKQ